MLFIGLPALAQRPGSASAPTADSVHQRLGIRYSGFTNYYGYVSTDYSGLNRKLAPFGFAPLSPGIVRTGVGFSMRTYSGLILDLAFLTIGFDRSTSNGTEVISSSYTNYAQASVGYSVIRLRKLAVYPYGGLSLQSGSLNFSRAPRGDTIYNSILGMNQGDRGLSVGSTSLGYQAGLGIDWLAYRNPLGWLGVVLFVKAGEEGRFGTESYRIHGVNFVPGIRNGGLGFVAGVKVL